MLFPVPTFQLFFSLLPEGEQDGGPGKEGKEQDQNRCGMVCLGTVVTADGLFE